MQRAIGLARRLPPWIAPVDLGESRVGQLFPRFAAGLHGGHIVLLWDVLEVDFYYTMLCYVGEAKEWRQCGAGGQGSSHSY